MYLTFFGLREEPFRLTPDPRFLHLAEPHRAVLATLIRGVVYRKGFMVITGPVGTGKTTLLHAALQFLSGKFFPGGKLGSALLVNPTLSRDEFLEAVLDELEVTCPATKPRRLAVLHQFLQERQQAGGTTVLAIDEAHLLAPELLEEVRLLSNTDTYREKLLQMVLCGQPELLEMLAGEKLAALRQRIASRCHLRALSLAETHAYIAQRLHAAGLRSHSLFTPAALEEIQRFSHGVPRAINLICDQALTLGFDTQRNPVTPDLVEDAAFSLGLTGLAEGMTAAAATPGGAGSNGKNVSPVEILSQALQEGRMAAGSKS